MPYLYRRAITIDHTKVPSDQSNFPVCFSGTYSWLATLANGGQVTNGSGFDIIFSSDPLGSTTLDFEIESYSATDGKVAFWIRIPSLSSSVDTILYVFYGNSSITTSQANPTGVWDVNYKAVFHMKVATTSGPVYTVADSTGNGHAATRSAGNDPTDNSGQIDGASKFDSSGNATLTLDTLSDLLSAGSITVELWVKGNDVNNALRYPIFGSTPTSPTQPVLAMNYGDVSAVNNVIELQWVTAFPTLAKVRTTSNTLSNGAFNHLVIVLDLGTIGNSKIYFNGAANSGTGSVVGSPGTTFSALGSNMSLGYDGFNNNPFDGTIDELRFTKGTRSADWATTSFNNQSSPSAFYSVSPGITGVAKIDSSSSVFAGGSIQGPIGFFGNSPIDSDSAVYGIGRMVPTFVGSGLIPSSSFVQGGGLLGLGLVGIDRTDSSSAVYGTGKIVPSSAPISVLIAGVNRTAWIGTPVKRVWQLGSICTCTLIVQSSLAGAWRPNEIDEVIIMLQGGARFFTGWVDNYQEMYYPGSGQFALTINCVGLQAALEKAFVGIDINDSFANLNTIVSYVADSLGGFDVTYEGLGPGVGNVTVPSQTFNWVSALDALRTLGDQFNLVTVIDMYGVLHVISPDFGTGSSPFQITDSNLQDWQQITITRGGLYRNKEGVRNTQQLAAADSSPVVPGFSTTSSSRLSQIAWAQDNAEISAVGKVFESIATVQDFQDLSTAQTVAQTLLDEGVKHIVKATLELTRDGLEPGQLLTFNTTIPPFSEDLLVEQITSESQGAIDPLSTEKILFKHVVQASNSMFRRGAGTAWLQNLIHKINNPAIDRITYSICFTLAETLDGITNPGLSTGTHQRSVTCPKKGVLRDLGLVFLQSPPLANDVVIDVLVDGASIFDPMNPKLIMPAGGGGNRGQGRVIYPYAFAINPFPVNEGSVVSYNVLIADATAKDGFMILTVYG